MRRLEAQGDRQRDGTTTRREAAMQRRDVMWQRDATWQRNTDHHQVQPAASLDFPSHQSAVVFVPSAIGVVIHEPSVDGSHATIKQMMERGTRGVRRQDAMRRAATRRNGESWQRDAE